VKKQGYGLPIALLALGLIFWGVDSRTFGDTEIDMDDVGPPPATPVSSGSGSAKVAATPTSVPVATAIPTMVIKSFEPAATPTEVIDVEEDATPIEVHGVIKMKDIYAAGIKAYQEEDYDKAIRYLKKSIETHDPYSAKFYYAEANAMLGVIYQFHIIHYGWAYQYYRAALKFEKKNPTALRHIKEVAKYKNEKD
jgi:tetratricopeptide (TPR) repeat protein